MAQRYYQVVIHPAGNECPLNPKNFEFKEPDCNGCEFCKRIDTLGGEYWIDCTYGED